MQQLIIFCNWFLYKHHFNGGITVNTITSKEIRNLISNNTKDLAYKLMKSEFLTPIRVDTHSTVVNTVSDDENVFVRLFNSLKDYRKAETEIEPKRVPFEIILHLLKNRIDGFIVNIDSSEFILDGDFIERNLAPYTAEELKAINENTGNMEGSPSDGIFLTLLLSDEDYSSKASDGIIRDALGLDFDMATLNFDGKPYHLLFTSKRQLQKAFELFPGSHYYSQIIDLSMLVENFTEDGIEGVLIDFPDGFKSISTRQLLDLDVKENVKLRESLNYAFEAE